MQPIFDNLELIYSSLGRGSRDKRAYELLLDSGLIQIEPLTYIRGRRQVRGEGRAVHHPASPFLV